MSWAHVQGAQNGAGSGTTIAQALGSTVGVGNLVTGRVEWITATLTDLTSVTDDQGNTYNLAPAAVAEDSDWAVRGFWLANITNAPKTLTAHFANTQSQSVITIDEFSGGGASATIDKSNTNVQTALNTGTDNLTSGSVTTIADGELIYAVTGSSLFTTPVYAAGTGFTQLEQLSAANPTSEWKVQTTHGAVAATFSITNEGVHGGSDAALTTILTFKPTAAAVPTFISPLLDEMDHEPQNAVGYR